jgi:hypothetical protein
MVVDLRVRLSVACRSFLPTRRDARGPDAPSRAGQGGVDTRRPRRRKRRGRVRTAMPNPDGIENTRSDGGCLLAGYGLPRVRLRLVTAAARHALNASGLPQAEQRHVRE